MQEAPCEPCHRLWARLRLGGEYFAGAQRRGPERLDAVRQIRRNADHLAASDDALLALPQRDQRFTLFDDEDSVTGARLDVVDPIERADPQVAVLQKLVVLGGVRVKTG